MAKGAIVSRAQPAHFSRGDDPPDVGRCAPHKTVAGHAFVAVRLTNRRCPGDAETVGRIGRAAYLGYGASVLPAPLSGFAGFGSPGLPTT